MRTHVHLGKVLQNLALGGMLPCSEEMKFAPGHLLIVLQASLPRAVQMLGSFFWLLSPDMQNSMHHASVIDSSGNFCNEVEIWLAAVHISFENVEKCIVDNLDMHYLITCQL